jgi:hypothetical protein
MSSPQPNEPKVLKYAFPLHIADLERAAKESEQNAAGNSNSNPGGPKVEYEPCAA